MYGFEDRLREESFEVTRIDVPAVSPKAKEFRALCEKNECREYGTNWGCPPGVGTLEECAETLRTYHEAFLVAKRYVLDPKNVKEMKRARDNLGDSSRRAADMIRPFAAVKVLGDGGCRYCGVCTYPGGACRYPLQRMDSISGYGIDMEDLFKKAGKKFAFEDCAVTLCSIVLVGKARK
ncbi:MAG: DUF2284 domain-containing protein [Candidatus Methanomethylophilaceae archaeon]|jgi:predicted metal-binding protein|nr:DUF2284 domain-containing protein [Candidatus Methanomethylophilaceae archaeon]NCA73691.1 DUF2284 domain-containing protein [Gammaproteobacteria bacterium]MDD3351334.1 DUF2284 domain-containing protein [Candidatus Methanomethylophilaceae archaeon]MDD3986706.1 DUF2284 domain-containing protein [Candidatus Methanomethylophilaceae archaeon]MDD4709139.1 DUF2284 domain-containing protein [Candidatus Methanomethylophilaceae archaeon]